MNVELIYKMIKKLFLKKFSNIGDFLLLNYNEEDSDKLLLKCKVIFNSGKERELDFIFNKTIFRAKNIIIGYCPKLNGNEKRMFKFVCKDGTYDPIKLCYRFNTVSRFNKEILVKGTLFIN